MVGRLVNSSDVCDLCECLILSDAGCQQLKKVWRRARAVLEAIRPISVDHPCQIALHRLTPVYHVLRLLLLPFLTRTVFARLWWFLWFLHVTGFLNLCNTDVVIHSFIQSLIKTDKTLLHSSLAYLHHTIWCDQNICNRKLVKNRPV